MTNEATGTDAGGATGDQDPGTATSDQSADKTDRSAELEARLTESGRKLKAAEARATAAEAKAKTEQADRERLWFQHEASEDEKQAYRVRREAEKAQETPQILNQRNENALLRAIATEDNPVVVKALKTLYDKAEAAGRFPDSLAVEALRDAVTPEVTVQDQQKTKVPPTVQPSRGSSGAAPSVDQTIAEAKDSIKKKDGRFQTSDLLVLMQEKSMNESAVARG